MRKMKISTGIVGLTSVVLAAAGQASPAGAQVAPTVDPFPSSPTSPALPVEGADGWIHYDSSQLSAKLALGAGPDVFVPGSRTDAGDCIFADSQTVTEGGPALFTEDVAFNPTTCDRITQTSPLTPEAEVALNELTSGDQGSGTPEALMGPSAATRSSDGPRGSHKSAWIDPIDLTITSLAANAQINYGKPNINYLHPYQFPYDGWSSQTPTKTVQNYDNDPYQVIGSMHSTNYDFAAAVYLSLGLAGFLACGAHLSPRADFYHYDVVDVYKNGGHTVVTGADSDSKSGACSNLVHHASWTQQSFQS